MIWTVNGIVITSVTPGMLSNAEDKYRGAAFGEPWPLESLTVTPGGAEAGMSEMVMHMSEQGVKRSDGLRAVPYVNDWSFPPAAISNIDTALDYMRLCEKNGLPTRKLLCATTSDYPVIENLHLDEIFNKSRFLGYDYVSWDFGYPDIIQSPVEHSDPSDNWWEDYKLSEAVADADRRLDKFIGKLNQYGLFDNEADLLSYISTRWECAEQTTVYKDGQKYYTYMEMAVELWPCKTWELTGTVNKIENLLRR